MMPLRILIVEDDSTSGKTLAKLLSRRGHTVKLVTTGQQAIAHPDLATLDLVISDIGLPDMNGWEVVLAIKQKVPAIKAIALTGFGYMQDYEKSAEAGFAVHITKPVEMEALNRVIEQIFSAKSGDLKPET